MTVPVEPAPRNASGDRDPISRVHVRLIDLPLPAPISDAKVTTGRQMPLTSVAVLAAEITTGHGQQGLGFSYSKRAGGNGLYAHAREIMGSYLREDPNDIGRLWDQAVWAGASVGRSGIATQAIAAFDIALWDLKARRIGVSLAKLLGAHRDAVPCYNTSAGFLSAPIEEVIERSHELVERGIGGIKIKVGQPDSRADLERVTAVREALGDDVPLMVDANQQWDRASALRVCRALDTIGLVWIEEPLDAYDVRGHAELARRLDTPIATGEMLTSIGEHQQLLDAEAVGYIQPDAPRVGGITPFLKIATLAELQHVSLAPHYVMETHVHMAAAFPGPVWVEHFEWLEPLFEERLEVRDGRMRVPQRAGLGLTLSSYAHQQVVESSAADNHSG